MVLSRNTFSIILFVLETVLVLTSVPQIAEAQEPAPWQLKSSFVFLDSNEPFSVDKQAGGRIYAGGNAELGVAIAAEYRLLDRVGIEFSAIFTESPDMDDTTNDSGDELGDGPGFTSLLVGANYYFNNTGNLNAYVGPRAAFVEFEDFEPVVDNQRRKFKVDNEVTWGAAVGFNYKLGNSPWSLAAEVLYLDVDTKISERGSTTTQSNRFDPMIVNIGATYRF